MKTLKLKKRDKILAVVPESCSGPGWYNEIVVVYIRMENGKIREECLQKDEQSPEMIRMFRLGEESQKLLISAIKTKMEEP